MDLCFAPGLLHAGCDKRRHESLKERIASVGRGADLALAGVGQLTFFGFDLAQRDRLRGDEVQHGPTSARDDTRS